MHDGPDGGDFLDGRSCATALHGRLPFPWFGDPSFTGRGKEPPLSLLQVTRSADSGTSPTLGSGDRGHNAGIRLSPLPAISPARPPARPPSVTTAEAAPDARLAGLHAEPIAHRTLGMRPAAAVCVGDAENDVAEARALADLGCPFDPGPRRSLLSPPLMRLAAHGHAFASLAEVMAKANEPEVGRPPRRPRGRRRARSAWRRSARSRTCRSARFVEEPLAPARARRADARVPRRARRATPTRRSPTGRSASCASTCSRDAPGVDSAPLRAGAPARDGRGRREADVEPRPHARARASCRSSCAGRTHARRARAASRSRIQPNHPRDGARRRPRRDPRGPRLRLRRRRRSASTPSTTGVEVVERLARRLDELRERARASRPRSASSPT